MMNDAAMTPAQLTIDLDERSYPIWIGAGLLDAPQGPWSWPQGTDALIVSNTTVAPLYAERLAARLAAQYRCVRVLALPDGRRLKRIVDSAVTFQRLTDQQVADYLAGGEWHGKAGGYAIQGRAEAFIRFLSGSHSNVVGLPLFETAQMLRGIGWLRP